MKTLKNVSNKDCIKSLKDYLDDEKRNFSICLIGELGYETFDFNPTEMKKEFKKVKSKLKFDLHEILEDINDKMSNIWFWIIKKPKQETILKFYILMEYLQMRKYNNPGINFENKTIIIFHLQDPVTEDIHCQIVGSTPIHPEHPEFFETMQACVNTFLENH